MRRWLPALFLALDVAFVLVVYRQLPDRIAVHWGIDGRPDGWTSRAVAAFALPAFGLALWGLVAWIPSIDPRHTNIAKFRPSYDTAMAAAIALLAVLHVAVLGTALGWPVRIVTIITVGLGMLLIVTGNVLPRARSNFMFGIRTPWTISSDRVWARTNRIGGYLFVAAGIVTIAGAFLPDPWPAAIAIAAAAVATLGSIAYSYLVWKRGPETGR